MSEKPTSDPAKKPPKKKPHPPRRNQDHHGKKQEHPEDGQGGSQNRRHFQRPPQNQSHKVDMRKYEKLISDIKNNFADIQMSNGAKDDCTICCKTNDVFGIGECRHAVCIECAIRIRVLNNQQTCPVCRQENEIIYLIYASAGLDTVPLNFPKHGHPAEDRYGIRFQDASVGERYEQYLAHVCKICKTPDGDRLEFQTFNALRQHMVNAHQLTYCSICTENLNLFSRERRTYNRQALQRHIREGDAEDKSQKGHPTCLFCDERFFDNEGQYRHLRKDHFFCQFCESDGTMTNAFFNKHEELLKHYKVKHYVCEHEDCRPLGIAFSNPVEFNLHRTQHTGKGVQLDFQYNDRQVVGHGRIRRDRNDYRSQPNERIAVVPAEPPPPPVPRPNTEIIVVPSAQSRNVRIGYHHAYNHRVEDFPTLGGVPNSYATSAPQVVVPQDFPRLNKVGKANVSAGHQKQHKKPAEDFPTLGGRSTSATSTSQNEQWGKHTGNFAVIDVDERVESVSKPQPIRNNAPPIRSNQPPESHYQQKPQKKAEPVATEDFPSLPTSSGLGALASKSNWAAKTKGKNAITGVVLPKKKALPVPDIWPERSATTSTAYQPVEETWEDVPYNRKLTVKERRELQRKQQEAEAMELQERQKEIEEKMMIPPDEDLDMQAVLLNDISNSNQLPATASQSKKKSKKNQDMLKDKNAGSKDLQNKNAPKNKEKATSKKEELPDKASSEFPTLQSSLRNSPPRAPTPEPDPEPTEGGGISSVGLLIMIACWPVLLMTWLFSSVSNVLGNLSLANVLGEQHTQPLSSMTTPTPSMQKKSNSGPPPGLSNVATTSSNTAQQISFDAPPGFESHIPNGGPPPGLGYSNNNIFSSAPILSHQDISQPQGKSDDWSYTKNKTKAK